MLRFFLLRNISVVNFNVNSEKEEEFTQQWYENNFGYTLFNECFKLQN